MNSVWNKEEYANTAQRGRSCAMSNIGKKKQGQIITCDDYKTNHVVHRR